MTSCDSLTSRRSTSSPTTTSAATMGCLGSGSIPSTVTGSSLRDVLAIPAKGKNVIVIVMNNQYTMIYVNFDWDLCYLLIYYYNSIFAVLYTMHIRMYIHIHVYISIWIQGLIR